MAENSKKNGEKSTKKQMFVKGGAPGPGRGHKKEKDVPLSGELLDVIEEVIRKGMADRDTAIRLKSAGLAVRLQSLKKPEESATPILDPSFDGLITLLVDRAEAYSAMTGTPTSPAEMISIMAQICCQCEKTGGSVEVLEDVENDEA